MGGGGCDAGSSDDDKYDVLYGSRHSLYETVSSNY